MLKRVSGKNISEKIKKQIKKEVSLLDREIVFSIIYVGQDNVIDNFVKYKKKFGEEVGVSVVVHRFNDDIGQEELTSEIDSISKKSDAVIVQLPLPGHLNTQDILNRVPSEKDVDVLSDESKSSFKEGNNLMYPPVTGAIVEVLNNQKLSLDGKNIVIFGYGNLVGKPFGVWLDRQNISYQIVDRRTSEQDRTGLLRNADLIVSGVGVPNIIHAEHIKKGVALIDGGTTEAGKRVIGDINKDCYEKSLFYTPVPGGIGPITIAVLYQNILKTQKFD